MPDYNNATMNPTDDPAAFKDYTALAGGSGSGDSSGFAKWAEELHLSQTALLVVVDVFVLLVIVPVLLAGIRYWMKRRERLKGSTDGLNTAQATKNARPTHFWNFLSTRPHDTEAQHDELEKPSDESLSYIDPHFDTLQDLRPVRPASVRFSIGSPQHTSAPVLPPPRPYSGAWTGTERFTMSPQDCESAHQHLQRHVSGGGKARHARHSSLAMAYSPPRAAHRHSRNYSYAHAYGPQMFVDGRYDEVKRRAPTWLPAVPIAIPRSPPSPTSPADPNESQRSQQSFMTTSSATLGCNDCEHVPMHKPSFHSLRIADSPPRRNRNHNCGHGQHQETLYVQNKTSVDRQGSVSPPDSPTPSPLKESLEPTPTPTTAVEEMDVEGYIAKCYKWGAEVAKSVASLDFLELAPDLQASAMHAKRARPQSLMLQHQARRMARTHQQEGGLRSMPNLNFMIAPNVVNKQRHSRAESFYSVAEYRHDFEDGPINVPVAMI